MKKVGALLSVVDVGFFKKKTKMPINSNDQQLFDFLYDSDIVDPQVLSEVYAEAKRRHKRLGDLLVERKLISPLKLQKIRATTLGIPFVDLSDMRIPPEVLRIIPEPIARKHRIVSFERRAGELRVAMSDPENLQMIDFIRKKTGLRIVPCLASAEHIDEVLNQYTRSLEAEFGDLIAQDAKTAGQSQDDLAKVAEDLPVVRIVETLLKHAMLQSASDIHIEPEENDVIVRYRVDGILHDAMTLPKAALRGIVARIKVLANLKLDEHRLPQDGRFKITIDKHTVALRVSILPVFDGEKVVMRLLDESSKGLTLEMIGLTGRDLEAVHKHITRPHGMILVTGPTGSGKTTTLYTVLDILNTKSVNISTVEDPIEYRMERINQTQVQSSIGMTFAAALRALLRQDPDIIMVGEIRDEETLTIALHAAMTGHLVLSTLHTNSAAATIARMVDMGAEPFLIASTVKLIIAQRLVRRLCVNCRVEKKLDAETKKQLKSLLGTDKFVDYLKKINRLDVKTDPKDLKLYRAVGCDRCGKTGYKGRIGIFEVLEMTPEIEEATLHSQTSDTIARIAREKNSMTTMIEDGVAKAARGITTLEEVIRVTRE